MVGHIKSGRAINTQQAVHFLLTPPPPYTHDALANTHLSILSGVFQGLTEPTKPTVPRPLLSLYGIIYVTWYTSDLPEATGVRLRLPNSHALLGSGRPWKHPFTYLRAPFSGHAH